MNIIADKGVFGKYMEKNYRELIVILPDILLEGVEKTKRNLSGVLAEIRSRNFPHTSLDRQLYQPAHLDVLSAQSTIIFP
jgi:hypothetical protein